MGILNNKDAHDSGASSWTNNNKRASANDKASHLPSCGRVNSSIGSTRPKDFRRRSNDGKGLEYKIVRFCEYVEKYYAVKVRYELSSESNSAETFASCGLALYVTGQSAESL